VADTQNRKRKDHTCRKEKAPKGRYIIAQYVSAGCNTMNMVHYGLLRCNTMNTVQYDDAKIFEPKIMTNQP